MNKQKFQSLLFLFLTVGLLLNAQEGPYRYDEDESATAMQPPTAPPCAVPSNTSITNCNLIVYCYDLTGNRTHRFAPNCNINPWSNGGGLGNQTMAAPPIGNTLVVYNMDVMYPNPTNGKAQIEFDKEVLEGKLQIITSDGKVLEEQSFEGKLVEFDLGKYSEGTYYIAVFSDNKNLVKPIIKSNKYENIK